MDINWTNGWVVSNHPIIGATIGSVQGGMMSPTIGTMKNTPVSFQYAGWLGNVPISGYNHPP
jgi:hypothetical protein